MHISEFLGAVYVHWWSLMSCAIFTGISIWSAKFTKSNEWVTKASFGAAVILLFFASFQAWNDEYEKTHPGLRLEVQMLGSAQGNGTVNTTVFLVADIANVGTASIADDWKLDLVEKNGTVTHALRTMIDQHIPVKLQMANGDFMVLD